MVIFLQPFGADHLPGVRRGPFKVVEAAEKEARALITGLPAWPRVDMTDGAGVLTVSFYSTELWRRRFEAPPGRWEVWRHSGRWAALWRRDMRNTNEERVRIRYDQLVRLLDRGAVQLIGPNGNLLAEAGAPFERGRWYSGTSSIAGADQ